MLKLIFPLIALLIISFFYFRVNNKENFEEQTQGQTQESTPVSLTQFNQLKLKVENQNKRLKKIEKSMEKVNGMMGELEK